MPDGDCLICAEQRGEGPLVGPVVLADDLVHVSHRASGAPGYLFVESTRHVPYPDGLTDAEAAAFGRTTTRPARALRAELDAGSVHVVVRHAGTPRTCPRHREWPVAPRGDVAALAARLGRHLTS